VDGNLGRLRLGHGVVNVDLLTIPAILQNGFQATFDFQRGGSGYVAFAVGLTPDEIESHPQTNARIGVPFATNIPETDFGFLFRPQLDGQGQTEIWKGGVKSTGPLGIFNFTAVSGSPTSLINSAIVTFTPAIAGQWGVGATINIELTVNGAASPQYTTTFVSDGSGLGYFGFHSNAGSGVAQAAIDNLVITPIAGAAIPDLVNARPYHDAFPGVDGPAKVDSSVSLLQSGGSPQQATIDNLISSSQGINGVVLDFDQLNALGDISLEYKMSPSNVFADPISNWPSAPSPASITLLADAGDSGSDRVLFKWTNGSIVDRYLCIKVIHAGNTIAELYLGHLRGEMTGASGGKFTVLVGDILAVRTDLTQAKTASGRTDVDKSGTVLVQDILDTRSNLAKELSQITVP